MAKTILLIVTVAVVVKLTDRLVDYIFSRKII